MEDKYDILFRYEKGKGNINRLKLNLSLVDAVHEMKILMGNYPEREYFISTSEVIQPKMIIFGVYCQEDMTEGRGGMILHRMFVDEGDAWKHADNQCGIMGRKPRSGSWKTEKYGDWDVKPIEVF